MSAPWDGRPEQPDVAGAHLVAPREHQGWNEAPAWMWSVVWWNLGSWDVEWQNADVSPAELAREWSYLGPIPLPSETARLREALRPLADHADRYDPSETAVYNDSVQLWQDGNNRCTITVGDCRRARALLGEKEAGDE